MKPSQAVTHREAPVPAGATLIAKTDLEGAILYVNRELLRVSGFTESELLGRRHDLLRHPDMPAAVCADLWSSLRGGRPWAGTLKNRCKNGDYYWVVAHVTPIREQGRATGYLSVERAASRAEIAATERRYGELRDGRRALRPLSVRTRLNVLRRSSLKARLSAAFAFLALVLIGVGAVGLHGLAASNARLHAVHQDAFVPVTRLASILELINDNRMLAMEAAGKATPEVIRGNVERILANRDAIVSQWDEFTMHALSPEADALAEEWGEKRTVFIRDGMAQAVGALRAGRIEEARRHVYGGVVETSYLEIRDVTNRLAQALLAQVERAQAAADAEHRAIRSVSIGAIAAGLAFTAVALILLLRSMLRPLATTAQVFDQIMQGNYGSLFEVPREDEIGRVLLGLRSLQTVLGFSVSDARERADEAQRIKTALDHAGTAVLLADPGGRVVYANRAATALFSRVQEDVRAYCAEFDPERLVGLRVEALWPEGAAVVERWTGLADEDRRTVAVGTRTFALVANPVLDGAGQRLGTCLEWTDRTDELRVQEEVDRIVQAAARGDFSRRIALADKHGFMRRLAEGINRMLEGTSGALDDIARVLSAIAEGDLTACRAQRREGAYGKIQDHITATVARLTEVLGRIREATDLVRTAAVEIASGNTDLSTRTEEQAASLQETASNMEQLTATVKQNADHARQAHAVAEEAHARAVHGAEVVSRAVGAMDEITQSSRRIADIIGVIDEIAFQTNLLALNAAVEAARAGEQGRGFAVVATEVRHLASRSAQAAREIKELIQKSVQHVQEGEALVEQSGEALAEIQGAVNRVNALAAEIAAASAEQSAGIEQVNKAVMQMDEMTQQNAALVEEAAAASKSMEEQALNLAELVGFFRLEAAPDARAAQRPAGGARRVAGG